MYHKISVDKSISAKKHELLKPMVVPYVRSFTSASLKRFEEEVCAAHEIEQDVIPIIIDSPGGDIYSLLAMVDIIDNSEIDVATVVIGKAMSCGAVLASCGKKGMRFISKNSTFMIHDAWTSSSGKYAEMKSDMKEFSRLNKKIFKILDKNSGQELGFFQQKMREVERTDWYLNPKDVVSLGIMDVVGIPTFNTVVTAKTTFCVENTTQKPLSIRR